MVEPAGDQEDQRKTGLKIPTPWGPLEVRGLGTILTLALLAVCFTAYLVWEGKQEHAKIVQEVIKVTEAMQEQTYVLTLGTQEREALNLSMPWSLRNKIRRGDQ